MDLDHRILSLKDLLEVDDIPQDYIGALCGYDAEPIDAGRTTKEVMTWMLLTAHRDDDDSDIS